jgi:hypothetical protein
MLERGSAPAIEQPTDLPGNGIDELSLRLFRACRHALPVDPGSTPWFNPFEKAL